MPRFSAEIDVVLDSYEVRKHVLPSPSHVPGGSPGVVIGGRTAGREPCQPGCAADEFIATHRHGGPKLVGFGHVAPVELAANDVPTVSHGLRHPRPKVRTGFKK